MILGTFESLRLQANWVLNPPQEEKDIKTIGLALRYNNTCAHDEIKAADEYTGLPISYVAKNFAGQKEAKAVEVQEQNQTYLSAMQGMINSGRDQDRNAENEVIAAAAADARAAEEAKKKAGSGQRVRRDDVPAQDPNSDQQWSGQTSLSRPPPSNYSASSGHSAAPISSGMHFAPPPMSGIGNPDLGEKKKRGRKNNSDGEGSIASRENSQLRSNRDKTGSGFDDKDALPALAKNASRGGHRSNRTPAKKTKTQEGDEDQKFRKR